MGQKKTLEVKLINGRKKTKKKTQLSPWWKIDLEGRIEEENAWWENVQWQDEDKEDNMTEFDLKGRMRERKRLKLIYGAEENKEENITELDMNGRIEEKENDWRQNKQWAEERKEIRKCIWACNENLMWKEKRNWEREKKRVEENKEENESETVRKDRLEGKKRRERKGKIRSD